METIIKIYSDSLIPNKISWNVDVSVHLTEEEKNSNLTNVLENLKDNLDKLKDCLNQPFQQNPIEHIYYYGIS